MSAVRVIRLKALFFLSHFLNLFHQKPCLKPITFENILLSGVAKFDSSALDSGNFSLSGYTDSGLNDNKCLLMSQARGEIIVIVNASSSVIDPAQHATVYKRHGYGFNIFAFYFGTSNPFYKMG